MMKTKQQLLDHCIKMRESGRSYRSLLSYLEANCNDETILQDTITAVRELENNGYLNFASVVEETNKVPPLNLVMGVVFLVMGFGLMFFLWGEGIFSTMFIILIGLGFLALTGAIK